MNRKYDMKLVSPKARRMVDLMFIVMLLISAAFFIKTMSNVNYGGAFKLAEMTAAAPLVTDFSTIEKYCGTGQPIKMKLVTDSADHSGLKNLQPLAFRVLQIAGFSKWINHGGTTMIDRFWKTIKRNPDPIMLYSKDHQFAVSVKAIDIDENYIEIYYYGKGLKADQKLIPDDWLPADQKNSELEIVALPCSTDVTVTGTVWQVGGAYELRGYSSENSFQKAYVKTQKEEEIEKERISGKRYR